MVSNKRFEEIWKESGMEDYATVIEELQKLGFSFDNLSEMDCYESDALSEWDRIHGLDLFKAKPRAIQQLREDAGYILNRAKDLRSDAECKERLLKVEKQKNQQDEFRKSCKYKNSASKSPYAIDLKDIKNIQNT